MESHLNLFLAFLFGITFNIFWNYILGTGYGVMAFRKSMVDTLFVLARNIQSVYEIQQIKYMSYEVIQRDNKFIEFQKQIDKKEMDSLKNSIIRNYINSVPSKYNYLIEFHDWDSAMEYYNKVTKER